MMRCDEIWANSIDLEGEPTLVYHSPVNGGRKPGAVLGYP